MFRAMITCRLPQLMTLHGAEWAATRVPPRQWRGGAWPLGLSRCWTDVEREQR